ncbi:MAG: SpoIIE family protein phosphatase [Spirochaetia bacterium]|nr:SpoIIE family protein phosphatase [Spirochaetia bacterium]
MQIINNPVIDAQTLNAGNSEKTSYSMSRYLDFYEDKSGNKTIEDIIKSPENLFHKNTSEYPAFGFSKSAFWGKFSWSGGKKDSKWYLVFDYSMLETVELYMQDPLTGSIEKRINGNSVPLYNKTIKHRKAVFPLNSPENKIQNIYFKVKSRDTVEIPLLLFTNDAFYEVENRNLFFSGLYYGIILVMIIYNFFLYLSLRDIAYLHYVVMIFSYGLAQAGMDGFLYQYLFPENGSMANTVRIILANVTIFFGVKFSESFLDLKKRIPGIKNILLLFYTGTMLNAVLTILNFFMAARILFVFMFLSTFMFLYLSIRLYNKYPPIRLYFFAWFMFILGTLLWSLKLFHLYVPGFIFSLQFGSAVEVTLLSFALGSRINLMNAEKETMKIEALKQKQLMEKNRFQMKLFQKRTEGIEKELQLAREIQISMIPLNSGFENIHGLYLPMDKIGGDFYDLIPLGEGKIGIFISDVSGHGIPAALITVMLRTMILNSVNEKRIEKKMSMLLEPEKFMVHLNNYLYGHLQGNFVTAFYGVYDILERTMKYTSAAHPPGIWLSVKSDKEGENNVALSFMDVSPQMPPLGVFRLDPKRNNIVVKNLSLATSDRVILYTDGLMDNIGYDYLNFKDGVSSFKGTILYDIFQQSKNMDLKTILEQLSVQLLLTTEASSLCDDVCVLVLEANR